jgi:hypothetical protein
MGDFRNGNPKKLANLHFYGSRVGEQKGRGMN